MELCQKEYTPIILLINKNLALIANHSLPQRALSKDIAQTVRLKGIGNRPVKLLKSVIRMALCTIVALGVEIKNRKLRNSAINVVTCIGVNIQKNVQGGKVNGRVEGIKTVRDILRSGWGIILTFSNIVWFGSKLINVKFTKVGISITLMGLGVITAL